MRRANLITLAVSAAFVFVMGGLLCPLRQADAQGSAGRWSSGWESEKALVRIGDDDRWLGFGHFAYPHVACNLRGDGKWILISNRACNDQYYGYYYDNAKGKWVEDKAIVSGLKSRGWREYPAFAYDVTGDKKWTLISHQSSTFYGYYWNGGKWVEDPSRVKGLSGDIGSKISHTLIKDLKEDGKCTLLTGTRAGTFKAFCWSEKQWAEDASRVKGLPNIGGESRPAAGFNVFGEKKWNLIATAVSSKSFRVFRWNGAQWNEDKAKAAGLKTSLPHLMPTLGRDLRGDGRWFLISAIGKRHALTAFQYCRVDTSSLPAQKDVTSHHPLATTVRIKFAYPKTWNHRIRYSTRADMSDSSWSEWFEDVGNVDVKLESLTPKTTYYYQVYTYVPWDTSHYVRSPTKSFTTIAGRKHIVVKPGESIQDALETLPPAGGTIELAKGVHDVRRTVVINRSNITIQGTHESEIKAHVPKYDVFVIPHEKPSLSEPWHKMPILENFTFKGFKVTSSFKGRGSALVHAWNVKNLTVENILDKSHLSNLAAVNPTGWGSKARGENIFIKNNHCLQSEITFCSSKNVHVIGNTITRAAGDGIDVNNSNSYVYIRNNTIYGGANYNIRGHSGRYIWIENNRLLGGTQIGIFMDGASHITIRDNIITGCTFAAINPDPQPGLQIKIINNRIYNNPGHGICTTLHGGRFKERLTNIEMINNVIVNNGGDGVRMTQKWARFDMRNNIIAGNRGCGINYLETVKPTIIEYNDVWNNIKGNYNRMSAGTGDISADPLFADPAKGDFHLKSKAGRWDPKAEKWVKDKVQSPCIDAGDPKAEFKKEPVPNGGRVNMGAYGNTAEASKSIKE